MNKLFSFLIAIIVCGPAFASATIGSIQVVQSVIPGSNNTTIVRTQDSDISNVKGSSVSVAVPMTVASGITANIIGNVSGTCATVTTAAQAAITSVGTLTGLTVSGALSADSALYVSGGNVGIGTSSPGVSLDVAGAVRIQSGNTLSLNNSSNLANLTLYATSGSSGTTSDLLFGSTGDIYSNAWSDYSASSTIMGWGSISSKGIYTKKIGKTVFVKFDITGTSNSTGVTFTVPYTQASDSISLYAALGAAVNNGSTISTGSGMSFGVGTSTITCYPDLTYSSAWVNSGTKRVIGSFFYQSV